jgi:hypothetical protein
MPRARSATARVTTYQQQNSNRARFRKNCSVCSLKGFKQSTTVQGAGSRRVVKGEGRLMLKNDETIRPLLLKSIYPVGGATGVVDENASVTQGQTMHRSCVSDQDMQLPLQGRLLIPLSCTFHFLLPFEKMPRSDGHGSTAAGDSCCR